MEGNEYPRALEFISAVSEKLSQGLCYPVIGKGTDTFCSPILSCRS
jgi:hypothetical protein